MTFGPSDPRSGRHNRALSASFNNLSLIASPPSLVTLAVPKSDLYPLSSPPIYSSPLPDLDPAPAFNSIDRGNLFGNASTLTRSASGNVANTLKKDRANITLPVLSSEDPNSIYMTERRLARERASSSSNFLFENPVLPSSTIHEATTATSGQSNTTILKEGVAQGDGDHNASRDGSNRSSGMSDPWSRGKTIRSASSPLVPPKSSHSVTDPSHRRRVSEFDFNFSSMLPEDFIAIGPVIEGGPKRSLPRSFDGSYSQEGSSKFSPSDDHRSSGSRVALDQVDRQSPKLYTGPNMTTNNSNIDTTPGRRKSWIPLLPNQQEQIKNGPTHLPSSTQAGHDLSAANDLSSLDSSSLSSPKDQQYSMSYAQGVCSYPPPGRIGPDVNNNDLYHDNSFHSRMQSPLENRTPLASTATEKKSKKKVFGVRIPSFGRKT